VDLSERRRCARRAEREMERERERERERESTSRGNPVTRKGMCKCHRER